MPEFEVTLKIVKLERMVIRADSPSKAAHDTANLVAKLKDVHEVRVLECAKINLTNQEKV